MTTSNEPATRPRLLLIDDVPANLHALVDLLAGSHELQFATSGKEALRLLQTTPLPDLILLDIMMPDQDGYAVCREIKRQVATRHIPVVFITALDERSDEILGFEAGAADYITKPFAPDVVMARVRNQLRHKFALDALRDLARGQQPVAENLFRAHPAGWEIGFSGQPHFQLRDMLGLAYLQCLLAHPGRYFSVEEVVFLAVAKEREAILQRATGHIDAHSLQYYRQLTKEVLEGRQRQEGPPVAGTLLSGMIEQLMGELRRAGILGNDSLLAIDDRERYRKSVGNAIRRATREIAEHDLALASHLQFPNLRLGYELVYAPEMPVFWLV